MPSAQNAVAQTAVHNSCFDKETRANLVTKYDAHSGYSLPAVPFGAPPSPPPSPPPSHIVRSQTGAAVLPTKRSPLKPQTIRRGSTFSNAAYKFEEIPLIGSVKV
jgi:hypothetical protein